MPTRLLVEYFPLTYDPNKILSESANSSDGTITLKNVLLQRANAKNQNGRIYEKAILVREAEKYDREFVKQNRALGELDHSLEPNVNLKNACLNIIEMHWEGDDLRGSVKVLTTPSGNILKELLKNGVRIGLSSRGMGSVTELEEGGVSVADDFCLISIDAVANPSTVGAFLNENANTESSKNEYVRVQNLIHEFLSEIR